MAYVRETVPPLSAAFDRWTRERPDSVAVAQVDASHTYLGLARRVHACARALQGLGVSRGDVVSFQLPSWIETVALYLAINRMGAIANPIIPIYREHEVGFIVRQAGSRVLVIPRRYRGRDYHDMLPALGSERLEHVVVCRARDDNAPAPGGTLDWNTLLDRHAGEAPAVVSDPGADALLLYTSGTEASPKGARHSHATLEAEAQSMIVDGQLAPGAGIFVASPLGHIAGIDFGIHVPMALGAKACLMDKWEPKAAVDLIGRERCTWSTGVTPFLDGLLAASRGGASLPLAGYRCGGADVPPHVIREAHARGVFAYRTYGCTEHPTITGWCGGARRDKAESTDGRPLPDVAIKIADPDDPSRVLASGQVGEICTKGPDLFLGYMDAALNARAFDADGWFRTGDLGWLDADGYLTIAGRKKDIIIRKGENISAKEVEDLLGTHPAVADVAVIGVPDQTRGERVCAVVVPTPQTELRLADIAAWLERRGAARQKFPEQLELVTTLPRTATGKVRKSELRARFGGEARGDASAEAPPARSRNG